MSFCTACGNQMNEGAEFCTSCGAKMAPAAGTVSAGGGRAVSPASAQQQNSGNKALKIVLIVFAVIMALGIAGAIAGGFFVHRIVRSAAHSGSAGNATTVKTPYGSLETLKDPKKVAEKLGGDVFPGATIEESGASSMTVGGTTTTHAMFTTDASPDDVLAYYKGRYPNANVVDSSESKVLVQGSEDTELLTINAQQQDGKTMLHVTKVTKASN